MPKKTRKKKPSHKALNRKLDVAWSQVVRKRADLKCEVCGKSNPNAHHYVGRSNFRLRWDPRNGVAACAGCHVFKSESFHKNPVWAQNWMQDFREDDLIHIENTWYEVKKWTIEEKEKHLKELQKLGT